MNKEPQIFNIGGRWERCRYYNTSNGFGSAYFIDKKWNKYIPAEEGRWNQSSEGIWYPNIRGGATSTPGWHQNAGYTTLTRETQVNASLTSLAMDSNYVYTTSGDAVSFMFFLPAAKTLNSIFYYVNAVTGSPGALTLEIRDDSATATSSSPGTTLVMTTTHSANASPGWNEVTGLSQALSADTLYYLVIGDAAGSGSNNNSISYRLNGPIGSNIMPAGMTKIITTSNGFTGITQASTGNPVYVLAFSDGTTYGNCFTSSVSPTNDGDQKGLYMDGWNVDVKLYGVMWGDGLPIDPVGINIWQNSTGPGGTPFRSSEILYFGASGTIPRIAGFTEPFPTITANTPHRIVMDFGAGTSNGVPDSWTIGTNHGTEATLRKAMNPGQGEWYFTEENAGVWDDTLNNIPRLGFFIDDFTPNAGSGAAAEVRNFPVIPGSRSFPVFPS